MTEVTNELIDEVMEDLQARMSRFEDVQTEIKTELQAVRGHMLALETDVRNIYGILGRHELRLERIERRLELVDEPTA